MTESKVLSIRINTEIYEDFKTLCAKNKKSKKDILLECINLLLKADKGESCHPMDNSNCFIRAPVFNVEELYVNEENEIKSIKPYYDEYD